MDGLARTVFFENPNEAAVDSIERNCPQRAGLTGQAKMTRSQERVVESNLTVATNVDELASEWVLRALRAIAIEANERSPAG